MVYLCPPPLELPPYELPELREVVEVQFSTAGSQRLQRLSSASTSRIAIRITMTGMMPMLRAAVKGVASLRLSRSFCPSSWKALATVSLSCLAPAAQVSSLA